MLIPQWAAQNSKVYVPSPGASSTRWTYKSTILRHVIVPFPLEMVGTTGSRCSISTLGIRPVWFEGPFITGLVGLVILGLKMGGLGVLVANGVAFFFFHSFELPGIGFRDFFCISFVPSHFNCPNYFFSSVQGVNRRDSNTTYITRLHMYCYLYLIYQY